MNVGGTARYVGKLVERIPNSTIATGIVQGSEQEDPCVQFLPIIRLRNMGRQISPLKDFQAWIELRKIIREQKPSIVHTHTFKAGLIGRFVGGAHKRIHTFHGHLLDDPSFSKFEKMIIIFVEKFLSSRTDLLISVGKKVGIELRAQGIGRNKNWESIAPGVDALRSCACSHMRRCSHSAGTTAAMAGRDDVLPPPCMACTCPPSRSVHRAMMREAACT